MAAIGCGTGVACLKLALKWNDLINKSYQDAYKFQNWSDRRMTFTNGNCYRVYLLSRVCSWMASRKLPKWAIRSTSCDHSIFGFFPCRKKSLWYESRILMRNYVGSLTNQLPKLFTTMECLQRTSQLLAFTRCLLPVLNPVTISRHFTHKNSCIFKEMSSKRPSMHQISGCKMLTSRTFHTRTRELPQPVMPSSNLVSRFLPGSSISRNLPSLVGTSWKPWYVPCASFATETTIKLKMRGIQKDVSPLTTKRIIRKKKSKEATELDKVRPFWIM